MKKLVLYLTDKEYDYLTGMAFKSKVSLEQYARSRVCGVKIKKIKDDLRDLVDMRR